MFYNTILKISQSNLVLYVFLLMISTLYLYSRVGWSDKTKFAKVRVPCSVRHVFAQKPPQKEVNKFQGLSNHLRLINTV